MRNKHSRLTTEQNYRREPDANQAMERLCWVLSGARPVRVFWPAAAFAQDAARMEKVEKENQELRNRLDSLEAIAKKEGILPSGPKSKVVSAMSDINISGFVTSSCFP